MINGMGYDSENRIDMLIWGAGRYGVSAYEYYKERYRVIGFIDKSKEKQEKGKCGLRVYSPDILNEKKVMVAVAMAFDHEEIEKLLINHYGIKQYVFFEIYEKYGTNSTDSFVIDDNTVILKYAGGLGNQLFVYAFEKCLKSKGRKVIADISSYRDPLKMKYVLKDVFPYVTSDLSVLDSLNYISMCVNHSKPIDCQVYIENNVFGREVMEADLSLLDITRGVMWGTFQSYRYALLIEEELRNELVFDENAEKRLVELKEFFNKNIIVGIHIRRGDYLEGQFAKAFAGICDDKYYFSAINYIQNRVSDCRLCFFSDDPGWVREHYKFKDAIYIDAGMFNDYKDWYDMYLMSLCAHNIIANSTFGWWGAWLNCNTNKIVIAPKKWTIGCDIKDLYPAEWIRL